MMCLLCLLQPLRVLLLHSVNKEDGQILNAELCSYYCNRKRSSASAFIEDHCILLIIEINLNT